MVEEIARKLLVVIQGQFYKEESFITLGPLSSLITRNEQAVYTIDDKDIGITDASPAGINKEVLRDRLRPHIEARLAEAREHTKFDIQRAGHLIKLIVGLIQEFGALTKPELLQLLHGVGATQLNSAIVSGYLLCAKAVGWITEERKGLTDLWFPLCNHDAATLRLVEGVIPSDKLRRRLFYREKWEKSDPDRYRGIVEYQGRAR
jgi:hypothetical protein